MESTLKSENWRCETVKAVPVQIYQDTTTIKVIKNENDNIFENVYIENVDIKPMIYNIYLSLII